MAGVNARAAVFGGTLFGWGAKGRTTIARPKNSQNARYRVGMSNPYPNSKHYYNEAFFTNKSADYYYFLGVALTDGNIYYALNKRTKEPTSTMSFSWVSKDKDWLDSIHGVVGGYISREDARGISRLKLNNQPICRVLLDDGCIPRKTFTVKLPTMADNYFPHFLRGCIDGDGSVLFFDRKTRRADGSVSDHRAIDACVLLTSASLGFLTSIKNKVLELYGIDGVLKESVKKPSSIRGVPIIPKNPIYQLTWNTRKAYRLLLALDYKANPVFSLSRKREMALKTIDHFDKMVAKFPNGGSDRVMIQPICVDCGVDVSRGCERCNACSGNKRTKIDWPDDAGVLALIEECGSVVQAGKRLGVSDNAIRHRLSRRGINV